MPLRKGPTLAQRFLLLGAVLCIVLGVLMFWLREQCADTYFGSIIGCGNSEHDTGIFALNIVAATLMVVLIFFLHRYPRTLGLFAVILGLILIWAGDVGSFFGGFFSLSAGLLSLTSLL